MVRWRRIIGVSVALFVLLVPAASARQSVTFGKATVLSCDRENREAVFEGRVLAFRTATKMQMRFRLQAFTPENQRWRTISAEGFGTWITAPAGLGKYTYDKTVQDLLAPASYRAVVDFRWKSRAGRTIRTERAISPICKQPDARPDLVVRNVRIEDGSYVGVVFNRGREPAGPFAVDFLLDGRAVGTVEVVGLAPQTPITVMTPAPAEPCAPGTPLEVVADPRARVDEADEENNSFSTSCNAL
jgi:CARDB protein